MAAICWAKCYECNQIMAPGVGCTTSKEFIVDKTYNRIPNTFEVNCYDCNAAPGKYHHPNCDWEKCPRCGGQAISCACYEESVGPLP